MTNLNNYTKQFTLAEVLNALGLSQFIRDNHKSTRVGVGFLRFKEEYIKSSNTFSVSIGNEIFSTLKSAIVRDLEVYVRGFDAKAQVKNSSSYVSVLLSNSNTLVHNCHRIFRFLKNREKRYEKLLNCIVPIKKLSNGKYKNTKLSLRLNSLNEIPKANQLQYNRLLDDLINNLSEM